MTRTRYLVTATRGNIWREFEVRATSPDEACLMIERDLAGEWEWDTMTAERSL